MIFLRIVLTLIFVVITAYTGVVITNHGMGLLPIFFGDMAKLTWPGQFNRFFFCRRRRSGRWAAYRHGFGGLGFFPGAGAALEVLFF